MYFMELIFLSDFISNPLLQIRLLADANCRLIAESPAPSGFSYPSEAATYSNADRQKKLRKTDWLISAILLEFSHLRLHELPSAA
jgi:hypothetical protein